MMLNTENNGNGVGSGGIAFPVHGKQLASTPKKTALRDVQNESLGSALKNQESLLPGGVILNGDSVKVCGTKRLTPERPSSSKGTPSMACNGTNENVVNARRRFDLELGRGRIQNNVEKNSHCTESKKQLSQLQHEVTQKISLMKDNNLRQVPEATSSNLTGTIFSSSGPLLPSSFSKHSHGTPVAKVSPELPNAVDSKSIKEQLRTERFICLQNDLKQCDNVSKREYYTQMLMHLSAVELSKYAVELEKRAIQLTIEEGTEIERVRALKILAKSSPANMLESAMLSQPNKY